MTDIVPRRTYYLVYAALLGMLLLSWGLSYLHMSHAISVVVAMTIAIAKTVLVVLFFMHLRYSTWLTWVFVGAGIAWLGHMIIMTMSDYLTRGFVSGW